MFLTRVYDAKLAQASYLVGCQTTGAALVVDPARDIAPYLALASAEGLRITHVTETHIHADFVSGSRELAARTGAQLYLSGEGGESSAYAFPATDRAVLLHDGDSFQVGLVRIDVLHTPGHTPEHLALLLTDTPATSAPMGLFTGDFVFVGDVGRPDLLERAAGYAGTKEASARALYHSLERLKTYPDHIQLWPGHGAGSACGKALGALPQSTLGYERLANWAFAPLTEEQFIEDVLAGQPDPPRYFGMMKRINRDGPLVRGRPLQSTPRLPGDRITSLLENGSLMIDVRAAADFAGAHIPRTINIPLGRAFPTWAGSLLPYESDLVLVAGDQATADEAMHDLFSIGLDRVSGYLPWRDAADAWTAAGRAVESIPRLTPAELAPHLHGGGYVVVDVRAPAEWMAGHLPGVTNIPLGELDARAAELPVHRPIVVQCQGGTRSAMAASLLRARGFAQVSDLSGGFGEWAAAGYPVER